MDKKFLACLIDTREDKTDGQSETAGVYHTECLSSVLFCLLENKFSVFGETRKPFGAAGSTCCT